MKIRICSLGILALFLMLPCRGISGGKLDSFEESATQERTAKHKRYDDDSDDSILNAFGEMLLDIFGHGMAYGGASSWERVESGPDKDLLLDVVPRRIGDPQIPLARFDVSYQSVESDVDAYGYRAECGYGPFGLSFDQTHYREVSPQDDLDLVWLYGLYRMSFGPAVEVDLGFGALTLAGNEHDTRFAFSVPVLIRPNDFVGIEVRPAWSGHVTDCDLGLLVGGRYASLKTGYRFTHSPGESLDGPYAGLSIHF